MQPIENAIMRTVLYASVFKFALRLSELHKYLIADKPYTVAVIQSALEDSSYLQTHLLQDREYIVLRHHPEWIQQRLDREELTQELWQLAMRYGRYFGLLPFVRMVALTGSLAARNPDNYNDDFDYMLITEPGRVWVARIFAVLLVRWARLQGRELCPNYIVAANKLIQTRQDVFLAREMAQMTPITGFNLYQVMLQENHWVAHILPNAIPDTQTLQQPSQPNRAWIQKALEYLLAGGIGRWLEQWEYSRKAQKFQTQYAPKFSEKDAEPVISEEEVKGHFSGHGQYIIHEYYAYLTEYGIVD